MASKPPSPDVLSEIVALDPRTADGHTPWNELTPDEQAAVQKYIKAGHEWYGAHSKGRRWGNRAEDKCFQLLVGKGFEPNKRGYPDFWFIKDGRLIFIEVKRGGNHSLRRKQKVFMEQAASTGALCYRWDPDYGFRPVGHDAPLFGSGKQVNLAEMEAAVEATMESRWRREAATQPPGLHPTKPSSDQAPPGSP